MEALLKALGKMNKSVDGRTRLFVVGVFVPGFLISVEVLAAYFLFYRRSEVSFTNLLNFLAEQQSFLSVALFAIFVLAVSCIVGYLNRDATFLMSDAWLASGLPPHRPFVDIVRQFNTVYGSERVRAVLTNYSIFELPNRVGKSCNLPRGPDFYIREFCKLWLSVKQPSLNTAGIEMEINVVMGLVMPTLLASVPIYMAVGGLFGVFAALVFIASGISMMYRINATRCLETEIALLNFLFAHWTGSSDVVEEGQSLSAQDLAAASDI